MAKTYRQAGYLARVLTPEESENALRFWSADGLANAIPIDVVREQPTGERRERDVEPSEVTEADVSKSPYDRGGKIFMTRIREGYTQQLTGSAQLCGAANMLLTVAHAVQAIGTSEWYDHFVFYRAYKKNRWAERLAAKAIVVLEDWGKGGATYAMDYAFVVLDGKSNLNQWFQFETGVYQAQGEAIGYPYNEQAGVVMQKTAGEIEPYSEGGARQYVKMPANAMPSGCSGGAWIDAATGYVLSMNSFSHSYGGQSEVGMYGPRFDERLQGLYDYASQFI